MRASIIAVLIAFLAPSWALSAEQRPDPGSTNAIEAQKMMDTLVRKGFASSGDIEWIEKVDAQGLAPTAGNVEEVSRLLNRSADPEVRVRLARLLGRLYTVDNRSSKNTVITRDLKNQIFSGDHIAATAAIRVYARIGYQSDTIDVLDYGLKNKLLDEQSYSQELAINLPVAPPNAQDAMASRLTSTRSPFGAEVLAFSLNGVTIEKISPNVRKVLYTYLRKHEPTMPIAIGRIGFVDCLRYANWLEAVATLAEANDGTSRADTIFFHLNAKGVDARKVLGYLSSPQGQKFAREMRGAPALQAAKSKAASLATQFPGDPMFALLIDALAGI